MPAAALAIAPPTAGALEALLVVAAAVAALAFRPWAMLRSPSLRAAWLAALLVLPWLWSAQRLLPLDLPLQLSGAALLVLMFGWPLAVWTLLAAAAAGALLAGASASGTLALAAWNGVLPATLALGFGLAVRRWLPRGLFVYVLGRAFFGTALAMSAAGALRVGWQPLPAGTALDTLLLAHLLLGWGEAVLTGMLVAVFVAFKPEWLATWSDARYLPDDRPTPR